MLYPKLGNAQLKGNIQNCIRMRIVNRLKIVLSTNAKKIVDKIKMYIISHDQNLTPFTKMMRFLFCS